jgi:hypothetical protein
LQGSEIFSDKGRLVATLDSNGNIVGTPIVGAMPEEYIPAVKALL